MDKRECDILPKQTMIDSLGHWLTAHPVTFGLTTLGLSCLVSVYAGDIRRFLSIPPQKINLWILRTRISNAEYRLLMLKYHTRNPQAFIAYLAKVIITGLTMLIILALIIFIAPKPAFASQSPFTLPLIFASGFVSSRLVIAYLKCSDMELFAVVTQMLEDKIRGLKLELVAKDPTAKGETKMDPAN